MPKPGAPYSLGIKSGRIVATAGIVSIDAAGKTVGTEIRAQTRQVLETIKDILAAEGASLFDIVKTTIYLPDFANYQGMNDVYREYFSDQPPARATVGARLVRDDWLVEIEAIAVI
jgi:reactive intermediate/imine deaminase